MARIRTIKPAFFRSLTLNELHRDTRLTFIGLWTYVDDEGRGVDNTRLVKSEIWPLDDDYTIKLIERDLDSLAQAGLINRYRVNGRSYFCVTAWKEHQVINHKSASILPDPLEADEDSRRTPGGLPEDSHPEGKGREGKGREKACDPEPGRVDVPDDFPTFWNLYPKRHGKKDGKAITERLWKNLKASDRVMALECVVHYAASCNAGLTLAKDPERWIKGRHWVDWTEPAVATPRPVGGVSSGSIPHSQSYYARSQK